MRAQLTAILAAVAVAIGAYSLTRLNEGHHPHRHHPQPAESLAVVPDITSIPESPSVASPSDETVRVYYCRPDGRSMGSWTVRLGGAHDAASVTYLAAVKAVHGPADTIDAVRFPVGTTVRHVDVEGKKATVDLSRTVAYGEPGGLAELGEFKALVWTLTGLPHIRRVQIRVGGAVVPTLPGGHLELDEPLTRSDF
jgi:spore germination protein GerM